VEERRRVPVKEKKWVEECREEESIEGSWNRADREGEEGS
jgi:hypothetical protein